MLPFRLFGCMVLASCLSGCGAQPNIIPNWPIDFAPDLANENPAKVDGAARQIGFVLKPAPQSKEMFADGPGVRIEAYIFPSHPSTGFALYRMLNTERYRVMYTDDRTGGFELTSIACEKYMELVAALKAKFSPAKLEFYKETCQP
jgi:hypothetical protein